MIYIDALIRIAGHWSAFIILCAVSFQIQKLYVMYLQKVGGRKLMLIPASFSVPIHELSHYIAAKLCFQKIEKLALFTPNNSSTLGYVTRSYRPNILSPFANAFIGMAPLLGGFGAIYLVSLWLNPDAISLLEQQRTIQLNTMGSASFEFVSQAYSMVLGQFSDGMFWAWYLLVANIAVFSIPSSVDFKGAALGLVVVLVAYVAIVAHHDLTGSLHNAISSVSSTFTPILFLSTTLVGILLLILVILDKLLKQKQTH